MLRLPKILLITLLFHGLFIQANTHKVISLAPSLTEIVCAIGGQSTLVGVTDFCKFPEAVEKLPSVGGYLNPNVEVITSLEPTLVLALPEHRDVTERLTLLGIKVATIRNWNLEDLYVSFDELGKLLSLEKQADTLSKHLKEQQAPYQRNPQSRKRCMLVLGDMSVSGKEDVDEIYLVARNGFLNDLLELAGGENVWKQKRPYFPKVGQESLLNMDPDIIIELIPIKGINDQQLNAKKAAWAKIPYLKAAKEDYYVVALEHVMQAGPRYLETLQQISAIIGAQ